MTEENGNQRHEEYDALAKAYKKILEIEPAKSDGGWAEVEQEHIVALANLIFAAIDYISERDADGDQTINYQLFNRRLGYPSSASWITIPYNIDSKEDYEMYLQAINFLTSEAARLADLLRYKNISPFIAKS